MQRERAGEPTDPSPDPRGAGIAPGHSGGTITRAVNAQDGPAIDAVYHELRRLASRLLHRDARGRQAIQTTALVHDAWIRIGAGQWESRAHFFGAAAQAMRRILIEHARSLQARPMRRGLSGGTTIADPANPADPLDVLALHEALIELETLDPRAARLVELRYFGGLEVAEAAAIADVPLRTAERDLAFARAWLRRRLNTSGADHAGGDGRTGEA